MQAFGKKGKSILPMLHSADGSLKLKGHFFSRLAASITLEKSLELIFKSKSATYVVLQDPSFTKTARISENMVDDFIVGAYKNSEQPV